MKECQICKQRHFTSQQVAMGRAGGLSPQKMCLSALIGWLSVEDKDLTAKSQTLSPLLTDWPKIQAHRVHRRK